MSEDVWPALRLPDLRQYANRPEATKLVKQDRLIISDDIGYCDDESYFYLEGREQDVVVRHGATVLLPRVAEKIRACDHVEAAEVVDVNVGTEGELRAAVVLETRCDLEATELRGRLNEQLAAEERLSRVVILDAMPLLGAGKVDRQAIRQLCGRCRDR